MKKVNIDRLDMLSFLNGLVFYAPVALLVRTDAGVTMAQFFVLQAVLSLTVFLFEIPTGMITDRIGYKSTMILAQITMFLARALLLAAFLSGSYPIFVAEAVVEGFAACFLSGTQDAYIYSVYKNEQCAVKMAHVANFGTTGFVLSTVLYVLLYHFGASACSSWRRWPPAAWEFPVWRGSGGNRSREKQNAPRRQETVGQVFWLFLRMSG